MRIATNKPSVVDTPRTHEKRSATRCAARAAGSVPAPLADAPLPSPSLDQVAEDTDLAAREFEQTIAARLDQVKEQLRGGNYQIDYDRLAQRLMEEGLAP